jgi:hypothetical protein
MEKKSSGDIMNDIFKKYDLIYDANDPKNSDVFISKKFKIITRSGIDKIEAACNINGSFSVLKSSDFEVAILGKFTNLDTGTTVETIGEASVDLIHPIVLESSLVGTDGSIRKKQEVSLQVLKKGNVGQNPPYLYAIAEKRSRSRGVLRLAGLYDKGFYGEDEADAFSKEIREASNKTVSKPV